MEIYIPCDSKNIICEKLKENFANSESVCERVSELAENNSSLALNMMKQYKNEKINIKLEKLRPNLMNRIDDLVDYIWKSNKRPNLMGIRKELVSLVVSLVPANVILERMTWGFFGKCGEKGRRRVMELGVEYGRRIGKGDWQWFIWRRLCFSGLCLLIKCRVDD